MNQEEDIALCLTHSQWAEIKNKLHNQINYLETLFWVVEYQNKTVKNIYRQLFNSNLIDNYIPPDFYGDSSPMSELEYKVEHLAYKEERLGRLIDQTRDCLTALNNRLNQRKFDYMDEALLNLAGYGG